MGIHWAGLLTHSSRHFLVDNGDEVSIMDGMRLQNVCKCGCGKPIQADPRKKYINAIHRMRAWRRKQRKEKAA